jgi:rubrerythrin
MNNIKADILWEANRTCNKFLTESLIDTGKKRKSLVETIRNKIIEEFDAQNSYQDFINILKQDEEKNKDLIDAINEIKDDEIKHSGILMELLMKLSPQQAQKMQEGLGELKKENDTK